jgi:hypothetical protein
MSSWTFSEWADAATAAGVFVAAISLVIGVVSTVLQARFDRREKQARAFEVIHDRYQEMAAKRRKLAARTDAREDISEAKVYDFYAAYWSMHIDVWEYFRLGVISEEVYATWLTYLYDHLHGFTVLGGVNSRESWEKYGRSLARNNVEFRRLVEQLYDLQIEGAAAADVSIDARLRVRSQVQRILHNTPKWMAETQ